MKDEKSTRIGYIDYAKAVAIFLVVLGHTNDPYTPGKAWLYMDVCYAFHMPLFFLLSGFFIRPKENYDAASWGNFFRKNLFTLIFPYFLWGIIFMPFSFGGIARLAYGSWIQLKLLHTVSALWFLPTLFLGRCYCEGVFHFSRKMKISPSICAAVSMVVFTAAAFLLPHHNQMGKQMGNFWEYDIAFFAAAMMFAGYLLRPFLDYLAHAAWWKTAFFALVCGAIFAAGFFAERPSLVPGVNNSMLMCNAEYGPWYYCLLNAVSGSLTVVALAILVYQCFPDRQVILFTGANTLGIFLLHKNVVYALKDFCAARNFVPADLWTGLAITIPAFILSLLAVRGILGFCPELFGKRTSVKRRVE
ncbi:MAG: acyltransferase [Victivallaceae bacterium]|nr:acyltransferase [Victivallaceae bacterium]